MMSRSPTPRSVIGSLLHIDRPRSASYRRRAFFYNLGVSLFTNLCIGLITISKVTLHLYRRYSSSQPSMFLDLRDNPHKVRFRDFGRPTNAWDLTRFPCEPPLQVMTFYASSFPWYIEARVSNPGGVTLYDMFMAIWGCMSMLITNEDHYYNEMDEGEWGEERGCVGFEVRGAVRRVRGR